MCSDCPEKVASELSLKRQEDASPGKSRERGIQEEVLRWCRVLRGSSRKGCSSLNHGCPRL